LEDKPPFAVDGVIQPQDLFFLVHAQATRQYFCDENDDYGTHGGKNSSAHNGNKLDPNLFVAIAVPQFSSKLLVTLNLSLLSNIFIYDVENREYDFLYPREKIAILKYILHFFTNLYP
jgi:hypothetical protein